MIRRRAFIAGLGAAAAWPLAARAQQGQVRRIAILEFSENDLFSKVRLPGFLQRLEMLGWRQGQNLRVDVRFAGNADRVADMAKEMLALNPDVILTYGTTIAGGLHLQTRKIPIVFLAVSDPVGSGFVASLARPGGNMTGFLAYEEGIPGKWLAMLKELAPSLTRVALVGNPDNAPFDYFLRAGQAAARSLMIDLVPVRAATSAEITGGIETFAREGSGGLVMLPGAGNADLLFVLAARYRLPAVYSDRSFAIAGGLMSYGPATDQLWEAVAAPYVDRILRGANVAELPVQIPTKYETVINLRIAKATGIEVPPPMLVRADEVIE